MFFFNFFSSLFFFEILFLFFLLLVPFTYSSVNVWLFFFQQAAHVCFSNLQHPHLFDEKKIELLEEIPWLSLHWNQLLRSTLKKFSIIILITFSKDGSTTSRCRLDFDGSARNWWDFCWIWLVFFPFSRSPALLLAFSRSRELIVDNGKERRSRLLFAVP